MGLHEKLYRFQPGTETRAKGLCAHPHVHGDHCCIHLLSDSVLLSFLTSRECYMKHVNMAHNCHFLQWQVSRSHSSL